MGITSKKLSAFACTAILILGLHGQSLRADVVPGEVIDQSNYLKIEGWVQDFILQWVEDDFDADRYGAKFGVLPGRLELNLAYYRAYSDIPVPLIDADSFQPIHLSWRDLLSIDPKDPFGSILGDQKLRTIE